MCAFLFNWNVFIYVYIKLINLYIEKTKLELFCFLGKQRKLGSSKLMLVFPFSWRRSYAAETHLCYNILSKKCNDRESKVVANEKSRNWYCYLNIEKYFCTYVISQDERIWKLIWWKLRNLTWFWNPISISGPSKI